MPTVGVLVCIELTTIRNTNLCMHIHTERTLRVQIPVRGNIEYGTNIF